MSKVRQQTGKKGFDVQIPETYLNYYECPCGNGTLTQDKIMALVTKKPPGNCRAALTSPYCQVPKR